ncbi:hypothetical protein EUTSA_v10021741mg [Eutrema salsugineum]|uniref:Uncharacterized protein n=1 Tax=Eutrema salsugineum TaxID=72664 RepID=V4NMK0_EUTSA|nr:uncharacterized protein LOC18023668 [Eutrema salsugineum]ESQ47666.1 hypothetical protein EUTSA_v10021741mg [Eutrema salsugineum]
MAVPIDLLNNAESSDEDFSDSEISYSSEDESMEDEPSEDETSNSEIANGRETERDRSEKERFWVQYPYLKSFLSTIVAEGLIPEYFAFERAKLIGDEKAKELNERVKALSIMYLELFSKKCELVASAITAMKSAN